MDASDLRFKHEDDDRKPALPLPPHPPPYPPNGTLGPSGNASDAGAMNGCLNRYTLMVAGQRTGKTSFLRLLLDTSDIAPTATKDQLASVAKFVQGCSGHTSRIRTVSVDVQLHSEGNDPSQPLGLTLVDTPSLDFDDESSSERLVLEMLRHVDSRFVESIEDEWKAQGGNHHVHLCIYFLDPDRIVPPCVPGPPAPLVPRARTNSFSQPEPEPVILEPPVTTNPLLCRPTLPATEINTIRRLSARVNVLPVVARADTLTNDRLTAIKMAIRRDLAEAGIGFGIFDFQNGNESLDHSTPMPNGDIKNSYGTALNGSSSSTTNSPPTSPVSASILRLPYALISPDIYSHSDGVARVPLSRHELVLQYTPSPRYTLPSKLARGRFVRNYRWGAMDVLDPMHSDFLPLRTAIFHHMETLQNYTRDYLFDKFRSEYRLQQQQQHVANHRSLTHHIAQGMVAHSHLPPLSHGSRPILAIDTAATHPAINRHPSLSMPRDLSIGGDMRPTPAVRPAPDPASVAAKASSSGARSSKQRTKKITVACNFCRSRKLKCDGLHPCSQCQKRSNPCDYMPQNKRRGTLRQRKLGEDSDSEGASGEDRSGDADEPSLSPEIPSQPLSRRSSNVGKLTEDMDTLGSSSGGLSERLDNPPPLPPVRNKPSASSSPSDSRGSFRDNELPHIATLSLPETSSAGSMSAPLPPIRPASEQQAAQRKRAATVPGKTNRTPSTSGPKVVACNFCRARKTKCDGAHPACSSCTRRNLPCNYIHDAATAAGQPQKKGIRRASTSKVGTGVSPPPSSPPPAHGQPQAQTQAQAQAQAQISLMAPPPPGTRDGYIPRDHTLDESDIDLKRNLEDSDMAQPQKKMRIEGPPAMVAGIR